MEFCKRRQSCDTNILHILCVQCWALMAFRGHQWLDGEQLRKLCSKQANWGGRQGERGLPFVQLFFGRPYFPVFVFVVGNCICTGSCIAHEICSTALQEEKYRATRARKGGGGVVICICFTTRYSQSTTIQLFNFIFCILYLCFVFLYASLLQPCQGSIQLYKL